VAQQARHASVTASVRTGAFVLAAAGTRPGGPHSASNGLPPECRCPAEAL